LPRDEALALCDELRSVAEAISTVVKPLKLNYECLGNLEAHVHWHVFPRYASEEEKLRRAPVWERPAAERMVKLEEHDERALMASLRAAIVRLIPTARTPLD
jgi:diadenosine tetraphosphate (Ap4A) HIT family hydrolase